jgi:hypothetical protein
LICYLPHHSKIRQRSKGTLLAACKANGVSATKSMGHRRMHELH